MLTVNLLVLAGLAFVKTQEISFESCNKTSVCVKAPGCETPKDCPALAMYHHNTTTDRLHFTMFFKSKWAAFAQNTFVKKDNRMVDAKGFTCTHPIPLSETKVEPLNLRFMLSKGFDEPEMVKADQISEVSDVELATVDGVHMCSFSRPISLNSIEGFKYLYNLDLSTDLLNIIVFGNKVDGTGLAYHGPNNYFFDKSKPAVDWKTFTGVVAEEIEPSISEVMPSSSQMASIYDTSSMMMMMSSKSIMASMSVSDSVGMTTDAMMSVSDSVMMEMSSMVSTTPDVAMSSKSMDASTTPSEETPMVKPTASSTSSIIDVISSKAPSTPTTTTRPTVKRTTKFNLSHATTCTASISVLVIAISALVTMLV